MGTVIMLSHKPGENGSWAVPVTLSGTPLTIKWKLTDWTGNVINSRSAVSVTPATTFNVVLNDLDLAVGDRNMLKRLITVTATYNSTTYGNGLTQTKQIGFYIDEMAGKPE